MTVSATDVFGSLLPVPRVVAAPGTGSSLR